jgi:hypothetical protein
MAKKQNNPARRHHIIPKLILKRFTKDGQVWVTDRNNQNSFCTNIDNAACIRDYYAVETTGEVGGDCIEQGPLNEIENLAEPIIDRMPQTWRIPKEKDWEILANFLALMYCRGPMCRTIIRTIWDQGIKVFDEYTYSSEEIFKSIVGEVCKAEGINIDIDYKEALRAREQLKTYVDIQNTYYVRQMLELASAFVPVFAEMTPNLERIDTIVSKARYVISDYPILAVPRSGKSTKGWRWYRNLEADLFFPLSSKVCLVLNYDKDRKVFPPVSRNRVAFVNHIVSLNSERVIISEEQDFVWLRSNRTIASSHQELLEFLKSSPQGSTDRVDVDLLKQRTLEVLKQNEAKRPLSM